MRGRPAVIGRSLKNDKSSALNVVNPLVAFHVLTIVPNALKTWPLRLTV